LRVAIAIHPFGRIGGGERLATLHAVGLVKKGHDVTFYTRLSKLNQSWAGELAESVAIRELPYGLDRKTLEEMGSFDRILIHHHIDPVAAFKIARKHGKKTVWYTGEVLRAVWERDVTGYDYRSFSPTFSSTATELYGGLARLALWGSIFELVSYPLRIFDRITVYRYRGVVANSRYMARLASKVYNYKRPISVVYPCSSIEFVSEPEYGSGSFVLAVGALTPNKNYAALIRAVALVHPQTKLVIAGEGPLKQQLNSLARKMGVDLELRAGLTVEQLVRTYENCLFVVVTSLSEPFGMTAVEAALAGKPSIVTERGGTREFVLHSKSGLVVDPENTQGLAKAIEMLVENHELRKVLGHNARDRALSQFTLANSIESLIRALEN